MTVMLSLLPRVSASVASLQADGPAVSSDLYTYPREAG